MTEKRKQQRTKKPVGEEGNGSRSEASPQNRNEGSQKKAIFIVLQENTRSLSSNERLEEMFSEIHKVEWDAILIPETWRLSKEIWETQQGHIMVESGKFTNKHGVAILLNKRWKNRINWIQCACERAVAMSISVNRQPLVLMSVYLPHSGYADHHVEKVYKTILKTIVKERCAKIIGVDINAELGPGEGVELSAVGHCTLNKANCRGEWMTQWLLESSLVASNTRYKKVPQKQVRYRSPKNDETQLNYVLVDQQHQSWSRDAESTDILHMGSDHRCVMAKFEIAKEKAKGKPRQPKAPATEQQSPYTSEQERANLDDGKYEKTIYVKTWTGRTITVVIDPKRATMNMKNDSREDRCSERLRHIGRRNNRNDSQTSGRNEKEEL